MTLPGHTTVQNDRRITQATIDWLDQFFPFGILTTDRDLVVTGWNQWMALHSGRKAQDVLNKSLPDLYPEFVERKMDRYFRAALSGQVVVLSHRLHGRLISMKPTERGALDSHMPQSGTISPLLSERLVIGTSTHIEDVSERIQREKELEEKVARLEDAMDQVNTLKGLLPICSYCKKIRDDKGYWNQLESYIGTRADVDFSHGICPECAEKYFPDLDLFGDEDV